MPLPALDVIFGLSPGRVEVFVKVLATSALEIGDDEAGVTAQGTNLDPSNHAARLRP